MKKNGFVSTTLIYAFFIVFLSLMVLLMSSYAHTRNLLNRYKAKIRNDFTNLEYIPNIIHYLIYNDELNDYEEVEVIPEGYVVNKGISKCNFNSTIIYKDTEVEVLGSNDECFIYYDKVLEVENETR